MERKCIYCGLAGDKLSRSDIIPDALTNAKIINSNVCAIEHNNKFSDLFEGEVIRRLAFITNELDIKSSKSKRYAAYSTLMSVAGQEYSATISSDVELFHDRKMRSLDGQYLLGPIEALKRIKNATDKNVIEIDVNQLEIEKKVNIDVAVFFSEPMYRMISKIAFEWYCLHNNVNGKIQAFESVIQFITSGTKSTKNDIVTIVSNETLYNTLKSNLNFGSHTILSYVGQDNSVNILVSLFGIGLYNVRVSDSLIDGCRNNIIYQELRLDAKRVNFKFETFESFVRNFQNKFTELEQGNMILCIPKDSTDSLLRYEYMYVQMYPLLQANLQAVSEPTEELIDFIIKNIVDTLQSSALTLRGLKRFVKERYNGSYDKEIKFNPKGTDKKVLFMFYLLFVVGQSNGGIENFQDLNKSLKEKFLGETIDLSDEQSSKIKDEIFSVVDYSTVMQKGATAIDNWEFE